MDEPTLTPDLARLAQIEHGATLALQNAERLHDEAQLLRTHGAFARAYALHQISTEECSKVDVLGERALHHILGIPFDLAKVMRELSSHKVKNFRNAEMSVMTEAERTARCRRDVKAARTIFEMQQKAIHEELNTNKNAALYVDFKGGTFCAPADVITEELAEQMRLLNAYFLDSSRRMHRLLRKLVNDPQHAAEVVKKMRPLLQELLRADPQNLDALLPVFCETAAGYLYPENAPVQESASRTPDTEQ
jgi:AbiV family abortive infection protein